MLHIVNNVHNYTPLHFQQYRFQPQMKRKCDSDGGADGGPTPPPPAPKRHPGAHSAEPKTLLRPWLRVARPAPSSSAAHDGIYDGIPNGNHDTSAHDGIDGDKEIVVIDDRINELSASGPKSVGCGLSRPSTLLRCKMGLRRDPVGAAAFPSSRLPLGGKQHRKLLRKLAGGTMLPRRYQ